MSPKRLKVRLMCPNPMFEKWIESWLRDAESQNLISKYKLRDALASIRSYPLPLSTGKECLVLRGFGMTLCNLIDEELKKIQTLKPITNTMSYEEEVQQVVQSVRKKKKPIAVKAKKQPKITKKEQKLMEEEQERNRNIRMEAGAFRIVLLVDTQETNGKNKRTLDQTRSYLESLGVLYEVRRLSVGDFLWLARDSEGSELVLPYIVERKRMDDLASSIRDGRFHEQKHRLRQCGVENVVYLVENYGDNQHLGLPLESLEQAISNTLVQSDFCIVRTDNHWRSMVYLNGMTKAIIHTFKEKTLLGATKNDLTPCNLGRNAIPLLKYKELYEDSSRNAMLTVREVFVQQLLQLHSLSIDKALAIVEEYPTPRLLFDSYRMCPDAEVARNLLTNIRFGPLQRPVGEKISEAVYDFYQTQF